LGALGACPGHNIAQSRRAERAAVPLSKLTALNFPPIVINLSYQ